MVRLSVIGPVCNEQADTLIEFVRRTTDAVSQITSNFEILLVDDGSSNDAWQSIVELARKSPHVRGLRFTRNFGQHTAISAGLDHATGDWVVVMDTDLQDRPEIIPDLFTKAQEGCDIVFVNRLARPEGLLHVLVSHIFYNVLNFLAGQSYNRLQANFSIISRDVVHAFRQVPDRDKFYGGTLHWLGFRSASIDAEHGTRFSGKPAYRFAGRLKLAWRFIVGYSTRLLSVAIVLGGLMALTSFVMAGWIITDKLRHPHVTVQGWPSVMTAIFFAAGVTNIVLGFIGIYLGELFNWSKGRPRYVIGQTIGDDSTPRSDGKSQASERNR